MNATATLSPTTLQHLPLRMTSKNRIAICLSRSIDVDALALMIELATPARVVVRSTDSSMATEQIADVADLLVVDESKLVDGTAERLAAMAESEGLRVAVLVRDLGDSKRLAGLPAFSDARGLIRWIKGGKSAVAANDESWTPEISSITRRERQVWQLIAEGHSVRSVAEQMQLAVSTIDSHKSRLMKKLRVHKSLDLVRLAVRIGMVDP